MIKIKIGLLTLGCRVNQYETEALAEKLLALGIKRGDFSEQCDIYVINSCAVTEESVRKSRQMVRRAIKHANNAFVGVMGCASQLAYDIFGSIDGVSFVCGSRNKHRMYDAIEEYIKNGLLPSKKVEVSPPEGALMPTSALHFERTRAYIKIQDGCDGRCSYCVIPQLRGNIVKRDKDEILSEIKKVADGGFKEVVLTGIETASYGKELSPLIRSIDGISGIERIRMGSLEPSFMKPEFIDSIYDIPSLAPHFHISAQNGSSRILALMKRKYNTEMMEKNIEYIKKKIEGVAFSADIIVGFPHETEEDFRQTCEFVKRVGFLHLHIFAYSKRPRTVAAEMDGQIPEHIKSERLHILSEIAKEEKIKFLQGMVNRGKEISVLVETDNGEYLSGHSECFAECIIKKSSAGSLKGRIVRVIPRRVENEELICEL